MLTSPKSQSTIELHIAVQDHLGDLSHIILDTSSERTIVRAKAPAFLHQAFLITEHAASSGNLNLSFRVASQAVSLVENLFRDDGSENDPSHALSVIFFLVVSYILNAHLSTFSIRSFDHREMMDMAYSVLFDVRTWGTDIEKMCLHYSGYIATTYAKIGLPITGSAGKAYQRYGEKVILRFMLLALQDAFSKDGFPYVPVLLIRPFLGVREVVAQLVDHQLHVALTQRTWVALRLAGKATNHGCRYYPSVLQE